MCSKKSSLKTCTSQIIFIHLHSKIKNMSKTKKTATKATAKKKAPAKKTATAAKKVLKTSGNKVLDGILQNIADAKKAGAKSVVVFTTNETHYKESPIGFGSGDLKPKVLEAYKHIFCKYAVTTNLVNPSTKSVEWIVKLK